MVQKYLFKVKNSDKEIIVYTTRPDTLWYGATFDGAFSRI